MQTGQGTVYLTSIHGISAEELTRVAKELGVTQSALATFCEIREQKQVPPEDLDSTLREIAKNYNTVAIVARTPTYYSKMT
jgi:LmbE family N-acetylglucosaminyl deacetylase